MYRATGLVPLTHGATGNVSMQIKDTIGRGREIGERYYCSVDSKRAAYLGW